MDSDSSDAHGGITRSDFLKEVGSKRTEFNYYIFGCTRKEYKKFSFLNLLDVK